MNKNQYYKIQLKKKEKYRIFLGGVFVILILLLSIISSNSIAFASNNPIKSSSKSFDAQKHIILPEPKIEQIVRARKRLELEQKKQAEIEAKLAHRQQEIDKINRFLRKQGSPLVNTEIPALLYDLCEENNSDYRILLAISGVESGFCAADFNYNCFGYLNGKKYSSWEQAFKDIVPRVSRQYANRYGTDFTSLAKAYGMVNWEHGANKLQSYYNQLQ